MEKIYEYFKNTTENYLQKKNKDYRKQKSQFFTPIFIAQFMVNNLIISPSTTELKILEPSAGTGILILVLIEKILKDFKQIKKIYIRAVELDIELYEVLNNNLIFLKENLKNQIEINLDILNTNFILEYGKIWNDNRSFNFENKNIEKFDLIISNPPYQKINKNSVENSYFKDLIKGQPNLYHLFIALSLKLLKDKGNFIVISPKNYLGGKYTESLRNFIFSNYSLINLCLFNERNKIFGTEVLQEVCISHFIKSQNEKIKIIYDIDEKNLFDVKFEEIFLKNSYSLLFPKTKRELYYKNKFISNFLTLKEQNLEFKIGQVVQFRVNEEDKVSTIFNIDQVPLLIPQHIERNKINYREINDSKKNKNISLVLNQHTKNKLVKNENYVILRKNVDNKSKEFIQAAVYKKEMFNSEYIGIDNNLAYIKSINGELSIKTAQNICRFLNSKLFEKYYKMLNNSHTINSYELEAMLFPIF